MSVLYFLGLLCSEVEEGSGLRRDVFFLNMRVPAMGRLLTVFLVSL